MDQLLSIKHIPIKIEVNVTNAELRRKEADVPSVMVHKNGESVQVEDQPYKIDITAPRYDTYSTSAQENGVKLTYNAVARMPGGDDSGKNPENGSDIAVRSSSQSIESILSKLPKTKSSSVSYNDGTLSINYSMSALESTGGAELTDLSSGFEFIPGSIEFVVSQMPDLEIEYLGEPIYFPRSADPNYEGAVDVFA